MRVHIHTDNDAVSGSETTLIQLAQQLAATDQPQLSLSIRHNPAVEAALKALLPSTLPIHALPMPQLSYEGTAWRRFFPRGMTLCWDVPYFVIFFKRLNVDVIHVNNGGWPGATSCLAAAMAGRVCGIPVLMVVNNQPVPQLGLRRRLHAFAERCAASSVTCFVTGSAGARDMLKRQLGSCADVRAIPNVVAPFAPRSSPHIVRQRLGLEMEAIVVLHAARFELRKGHAVLVKAWESVSRRCPNARLIMAGEGIGQLTVRTLVDNSTAAPTISFANDPDGISDLLSVSDILTLPSLELEDFPLVVLEAMQAGVPVVASALQGMAEQISDPSTGWLVPPGDPEALADALIAALDNAPERERRAVAGKLRLAERFSPGASLSAYLELWRELAMTDRAC